MDKICWANTENFEDSNFVIVGIPDESESHAKRKGTSEAPLKIREISKMHDKYERKEVMSLGHPFDGFEKKVYDFGNIKRSKIENVFNKIVDQSKIPISIGGDHSISRDIIKTISKKYKKISLIYFDAHPDFVSSASNYYGSVVNDIISKIKISSSVEIGIRTPEKEELENLKKYDFKVITPFDIIEKGINNISTEILNHIGNQVYVSIDMDCVDPAFAPGVSVPVPMGLSSLELVFLLKQIARRGIIGMDLMEVCPRFDINDRTSHLASRIIGEVVYSMGDEQND